MALSRAGSNLSRSGSGLPGRGTWTPPPPDIWNPYEKGYGELRWFRHGTAFERRYAPRWPLLSARLNEGATLLCTASTDKTVRLHEAESGKEVRTIKHNEQVRFACFSPDGTLLCTACDDCFARVFDVETGEKIRDLQHRSRVTGAAFSKDGYLLCTGSKDKTARVFAVRDRPPEEVDDLEGATSEDWVPKPKPKPKEVKKEVAPIEEEEIDPDFLPGGRWGRLGAWTRAQEGEAPKPKNEVEEAEPTPIPQNVDDPPIVLNHDTAVLGVGFDPEAKRLCTAVGASRFFGVVTVFDMETQKELNRFEGHEDAVTSVEFSSDGKLLITASRDKTARIWSIEEKRELHFFSHPNWVSSAAASIDGRWICTACEDGFARVWDVKHRKELVKLPHGGPVTHASFGPAPPGDSAEPAWKLRAAGRKPPALTLCTSSADGAARLFGMMKN